MFWQTEVKGKGACYEPTNRCDSYLAKRASNYFYNVDIIKQFIDRSSHGRKEVEQTRTLHVIGYYDFNKGNDSGSQRNLLSVCVLAWVYVCVVRNVHKTTNPQQTSSQ